MSIALHYSFRQVDNKSFYNSEQIPEDSVEQVYLKCCDLLEFPEWLTNLQNLTHINISSNAIERVPIALKFLTSLNYLDLSDNRLEGELSSTLFELVNLRYLDVAGNYIETIPTGENDKGNKLKSLTLIAIYFPRN